MNFTEIELSTFVASCRTIDGALELARFMERKFPLDSAIPIAEQIHKFNVVVDISGKVEVHSAFSVGDLGREEFRKYVSEFRNLKLSSFPAKKPIVRISAVPVSAILVA